MKRFLPRVCLYKNIQSTEKSSFSIYDLTYNMLSKSIHVVHTIHIHIIYFMIHGQQTRRSFFYYYYFLYARQLFKEI